VSVGKVIHDMPRKSPPIRILHLEDSDRDAALIQDLLEAKGGTYEFIRAADRSQFEATLDQPGFDLILCDFNLPDFDGLSALKLAKEKHPETPLIIVSGAMNSEEAVECLKAGATDYLLKQRLERLPSAVERALNEAVAQRKGREAERQLAQERELSDAILNNMPSLFYLFTADGRFLRWNRQAETVSGYSGEEIARMHPLDFFASEHRERVAARISEVFQTGRGEVEADFLTKQGARLPFMMNGASVVIGGKQCLAGVGIDISERKRAEEKLREKEYLLSQSQRIAHIGTWSFDLVNQSYAWSDETYRIYGVSPDTFVFSMEALFGLVHPEDRHAMREWSGAAMAGDPPRTSLEFRIVRPDGSTRVLSGQGKIIAGTGAHPAFLIGTVQDITERKQAEEILLASQKRMAEQAMMLSSVRDAVIVRDLDQRIFYWNAGAERLYGWTAQEAFGRKTNELLYTDSNSPAPMEKILRTGEWRGELLHRTKDGREVVVESFRSLLTDESGKPAGVLSINTDISSRKEAEAARSESERFAKAALDALGAHVAILDQQGVIVAVNRAWRKFAESNEGDMERTVEGANYLEICERSGGDAMRVVAGIRAVMNRESDEFTLEYPCHSPEEQRWFLCRVTRFSGGGPVRVAVAHENVTLVKQVQAQLGESHEMFRSLARVAPVGIFRMDAQGHCTYVNHHFCVMTGLAPEQAFGAGWTFAVHPEDRARVFQEWNQTVNQQHSFHSECRLQKPDGTVIWCIAQAVELSGENGRVLGYVGTIFNITVQKQTEAVLRTLSTEAAGLTDEAFFQFAARRLAELLGTDLGFVGRLDGERRDHVQTLAVWTEDRVAPNFLYNLDGTPCENVVGKELCIYPSGVQGHFPRDTMLVEMGIESYGAIPLQSISGRPLGLLGVMSRHPLRDPQQVAAVLKLFAVRTAAEIDRQQAMAALEHSARELRQAKNALEDERAQLAQRVAERTADLSIANAELARASRLKSEFVANMSHELRTPLNAVLGLSESLLEQRSGTLTERQVRAVRTIESSGAHLLGLINDILDVSKVEAGKLELQVGEVNVRAICEASLQLVQQQAMGKRLDVQFTCEIEARPMHADARRLKQILVNLLSNAVKFTPQGGKIGLEVLGDSAANRLAFTVWDTGIGIAPGDQDRLFQPFVQLQTNLSREYEGTGLGLMLVQRLAEIHGGSVTLESEPGRGSRFTVRLPWSHDHLTTHDRLTSGSPSATKPPSGMRWARTIEEPAAATGPCVLLVEDNETNIQTIGDYLADHGFRVAVARNGKEAIERVRSEPPALILMDIQMPVMDGLETIRHLRADPALPRMPIIALTALAMAGDRGRCIAAGADDYLSKPVSLRELAQHVRKHLKMPATA